MLYHCKIVMGNSAPFPGLSCKYNDDKYWGSDEAVSGQKQNKFLSENNLLLPKIASGIQIRGAEGIFSDTLNTHFFETGQMYNGRMLYRNFSKKKILWLRFNIEQQWVVSNTDAKTRDLLDGFCCCKSKGLPDPSHGKLWYALDEHGFFQPQARMEAIAMSQTECKKKMMEIRHELSVEAVVVRGATGPSAKQINGTYKCCKKNFSITKLFYRCVQTGAASDIITLAYDDSGRWLMGQTLDDCSNNLVLAYSEKTEVTDPSDVHQWFTSDSTGCFTVDPTMDVGCFIVEPSMEVTLSLGDIKTDGVEGEDEICQERESLVPGSRKEII